jgi:hypothetical protein
LHAARCWCFPKSIVGEAASTRDVPLYDFGSRKKPCVVVYMRVCANLVAFYVPFSAIVTDFAMERLPDSLQLSCPESRICFKVETVTRKQRWIRAMPGAPARTYSSSRRFGCGLFARWFRIRALKCLVALESGQQWCHTR